MIRRRLCSNSNGGLGNRLKSLWSARRLDPLAGVIWNRETIGGIHPSLRDSVDVEPFAELFDNPGMHQAAGYDGPVFSTHRLYAKRGEPLLDGLFNETPAQAAADYARIAGEMKPAAAIADAVEHFDQCHNLAGRTGFHVRTQWDHPVQPLMPAGYAVGLYLHEIQAAGPAYVATDCQALADAVRIAAPGAVLYPGQAAGVVTGWPRALAEMLALGRCKALRVTQGSTFSEAAFWLAGGRLPVSFLPRPFRGAN